MSDSSGQNGIGKKKLIDKIDKKTFLHLIMRLTH